MKLSVLFISVALCFALQLTVHAQDQQKVYGAMVHYATVLVHTKKVENTRGANPLGIELQYSHQHADEATFKKWGFLNRQGLSIAYFNFNTPVLGSTASAGYFIEPLFRLGNHAELRLRGTIALGYLSNPNRNNTDSTPLANHNYGSNINAFLQLSGGVTVHFNTHISGYLSGNFNHDSNGGFAIPNRGVNYPSVSLGVLYHAASNTIPRYTKSTANAWVKDKHIRYEAALFASPKDGWAGEGIHYSKQLLIGGMLLASRQVSKVIALTLATEAYYDGGISLTKKNIGDNTSSFFAGVLIGNELFLNKFVFSQQLGFHIYKQTDYYNTSYLNNINPLNTFYQRYGLTYKLSEKYKVGFNMLSRVDFADFIDIRMLYRIK